MPEEPPCSLFNLRMVKTGQSDLFTSQRAGGKDKKQAVTTTTGLMTPRLIKALFRINNVHDVGSSAPIQMPDFYGCNGPPPVSHKDPSPLLPNGSIIWAPT